MDKKTLYRIIIIALAIFLQIDWIGIFKVSNKNSSKNNDDAIFKLKNDQFSQSFILKQYETATQEIQMRLEQEKVLFIMKFSLIGAILAVLFYSHIIKATDKEETINKKDEYVAAFRTSAFVAMICWGAVITSSIVDLRLLFNSKFLVQIGSWIRNVVEPVMLVSSEKGWENQVINLTHSRVYPVLCLNWNLLTLILFVSAFWIFQPGKDQTTSKICCFGSCITFLIFCLIGIHYHYDWNWWNFICVSASLVGLVLCARYWIIV